MRRGIKIIIGSDIAGHDLKEEVLQILKKRDTTSPIQRPRPTAGIFPMRRKQFAREFKRGYTRGVF